MDGLNMELKMPLIEKLISACNNLKAIISSGEEFDTSRPEITDVLNKIFPEKQCVNSVLTKNTDNIFFGVVVNPTITNVDLMNILIETEPVNLERYMVEIDSKAVESLSADDLAVLILHDVEAIMAPETITRLRSFIDVIVTKQGESIDIKNSINYSNILIFGIKRTMRQISSLMSNLNEDVKSWYRLADIQAKIKSIVPGILDSSPAPELSFLEWCLVVYKDLSTQFKYACETLEDAKPLTGSQFEKDDIDKVVKSLRRAASESFISESAVVIDNIMHEAKGFTLFKGLKKNGLRSIEDDLYEYKVRIKNCTEQEDAIYILRCINARIAILEDYIMNEDISDAERNRWQNVIDQFRELRTVLGSKKFTSATSAYNAFLNIDYDAIDKAYGYNND